jgi:hemerythrin-like domain-containing protein
MNVISRRTFIGGMGISSLGVFLGGCARKGTSQKTVTAVEDLMREHGVLQRMLLVYAETAPKLRENPTSVIAEGLQKTAKLFRSFGEDYHERKLEETHVFPGLLKGGAPISDIVSTLVVQHEKGREITDYILAVTQHGRIEEGRADETAQVLESFVLMYQNHVAREDTIVFPAWKQVLSAGELEEMAEKFEDMEHEQFGKDGFEKTVSQVAEIEISLGLSDLGQFTAQPPSRPW